jgi:5-enolpyruvylshikimate-3-phosphate synthase
MQQLKTITVKTSNKVESVHTDTLYAVIENCYNSLQIVEADCTGASYFLSSANIFAQLQELYASNMHYNEYVSLQSVMEIFANNITYYDEEYSLFTSVVENTAMQNVKLQDYTCLHN